MSQNEAKPKPALKILQESLLENILWTRIHTMHVWYLCHFRCIDERGPGFTIRTLYLDFGYSRHHLHIVRWAHFCSLHRYHSADPHVDWNGEWLMSLNHTNICVSYPYSLQWICVPFLLTNPYSDDIATTALNFTYQAPWVSSIDSDKIWRWIDQTLLLVRARNVQRVCYFHTFLYYDGQTA